jgi:hypothetical protein
MFPPPHSKEFTLRVATKGLIKMQFGGGGGWAGLISVIPVTQKVVIRRIVSGSQVEQKVISINKFSIELCTCHPNYNGGKNKRIFFHSTNA